MLNGKKTYAFLLRKRKRQDIFCTTPIQHFPVGSSQENKARKISGGGGSRGREYIYIKL